MRLRSRVSETVLSCQDPHCPNSGHSIHFVCYHVQELRVRDLCNRFVILGERAGYPRGDLVVDDLAIVAIDVDPEYLASGRSVS